MATSPAWWLVGNGAALAGPFPRRGDADTAAPPAGQTWEDIEDLQPVYGVRLNDGSVERRPSPEDKAFEAHLSEQLDRLADGYGAPLAQHARAELARAIATALVEAGFEMHDCAARSVLGSVCLTSTREGVIVAWTQHDRMATEPVRGYDAYQVVQETMNYALADVLGALGFLVEGFGQATAHIVTGAT